MTKSTNSKIDASQLELREKVVNVRRVTKVTKGGRSLSFGGLVVLGDGAGVVGAANSKAKEISKTLEKAANQARKNLVDVPILRGTIPHQVTAKYKASRVLLKPAAKGTGVIAGGGMRHVLESVGITDILAKSQGSNNPYNLVQVTLKALQKLRDPLAIARKRGRSLEQIFNG